MATPLQVHCPECGSIRPSGPLDGLCPQCLLHSTLELSRLELPNAGGFAHAQALPCRFAQYQLLEIVGRGAAGTVFRARDESLNREVAIKALHSGPFASPESIRRLFTEARVAAQLAHPHITTVFEISGGDQAPFVVMPFLPGGNLASRLGEFTSADFCAAARLIEKIAGAVHFAHQHGVLHRDLKPANILFDSADEPRVADFGLARVLQEESSLTQENTLLGTPAYMSPEQAAGSSLSVHSDIYSLGAILYELLAGRPPFVAPAITAVLEAVRHAHPPSPSALNPETPRDLETICLKCLEKDPAKRYPTAEALVDDLRRFLNHEPITARPVSRGEKLFRWTQRNPALATSYSLLLLVLLSLLIGSPLVAYRFNQARKAESIQRQRAEAAAQREILLRRQADAEAYTSDMNLAQKLLTDNARGPAVKLLEKYRARLDLRGWEWHYLETLLRGPELAVLRAHATRVNDLAYSPDGLWLASCGLDPIVYIWDTRSRTLAQRLEVPEKSEIYSLAFSPDGQWLAAGTEMAKRVRFWGVSSWKSSFVLTNASRVNGIAFSPDGRWLAAAGHLHGNGLTVWDLANRSAVAHWPLPEDCNDVPFALAFSHDSQRLFYDLGHGQLGGWDSGTRSALPSVPVHEGPRSVERALFTENGTLAATDSAAGVVRVWSVPDWKQLYQLTNEYLLAVSARENLLITTANQEVHRWNLTTGDSAGAGMTGHTGFIWAGAFSPTEKIIATASLDTTVRLWPVNPPLTKKDSLSLPANDRTGEYLSKREPSLSADARFAATIQTNGLFSVWDMERLERVATHPWPHAELRVFEVASGGRIGAAGGENGDLSLVDLTTDRIIAEAQFPGNRVYFVRFSPDGSRLAVGYSSLSAPPASEYYLRIVETGNLGRQRVLESTGGTVYSGIFTPDNRYFAFGSYDSVAEIVDFESGRITPFRGHQGRVTGVSMTPDARLLATCTYNGPVRLFDGWSGEKLDEFQGNWENYNAVALSPDGNRLAAGLDGVDIWDLTTKRLLLTFRTQGNVTRLSWTPDMRRLNSIGFQALHAWRADSFVRPTRSQLPVSL